VLASNGYTDTSMGGGAKLLRLHQTGCAAMLTDGRLRDFDELAPYDFAAYCSGEATRRGGDRVTPFQANVPIVLDGVAVLPGEYVLADSPGAVVIPAPRSNRCSRRHARSRPKTPRFAISFATRSLASGFVNDDIGMSMSYALGSGSPGPGRAPGARRGAAAGRVFVTAPAPP